MKKVVLFLALALSTSAFTQIAPPKQRVLLNLPVPSNAPTARTGPLMMIGGASFVAAGLLTSPFTIGKTTTPKPFYQQGPRALAIVSGAFVFVVGVGITIGGN